MRSIAGILLLAVLCGCTGPVEKTFPVSFLPFSASLDPAALSTVQQAAAYARANSLAPVSVDGYHSRPDPTEPDTIQQERVQTVTSALVRDGVDQWRIEVLGRGIVYPQGVPMPSLPTRQVIIKIGL